VLRIHAGGLSVVRRSSSIPVAIDGSNFISMRSALTDAVIRARMTAFVHLPNSSERRFGVAGYI
jgi:hypothetical protein